MGPVSCPEDQREKVNKPCSERGVWTGYARDSTVKMVGAVVGRAELVMIMMDDDDFRGGSKG